VLDGIHVSLDPFVMPAQDDVPGRPSGVWVRWRREQQEKETKGDGNG
jgi:hypothetical protein